MALPAQALSGLAALSRTGLRSTFAGAWQRLCRGMAADATPSKSDIVHFLDSRDVDPDVDAAVKAYLKAAYAASSTPPEEPEPVLELASKVQRKYVAAQVVESGIQNISVPLAAQADLAPVKRYTQQLLTLGAKAGFEEPLSEVRQAVAAKAAVADSAKELVAGLQPLTSPEFHAGLVEALAAAEAETGTSISLDGASPGYKAFAGKVKALAESHQLPCKLLLDAQASGGSEDAKAESRKALAAWLQSAAVADATTELQYLRAEASSLLDKHLSKSAATIRSEQAAAMASLQRRIEAAKGAPWATAFARDLAALAEYDAAVAADPVNGPKVAVA
ncbi:mitochondrial F1F0 ATP synthase associated 31.2 kDa protein [Haematococcus lacustris]